MAGTVFVITGPSGVGKGTLIRTLLERVPELELAVSATTRAPRPGEEHGVDYHFLDDAEFDRRVLEGDFLEHAEYSGRRYGTLRSELEKRTAPGASVVLEIEVQGARQVARDDARRDPHLHRPAVGGDAAHAPDRARHGRPEQIEARLQVAKAELAASDEFAHVVHNDRLDDAADQLEQIVRAATLALDARPSRASDAGDVALRGR